MPTDYYITPIVQNIFCSTSTCNLNPLFDLVIQLIYESLDPVSVGRCEDESLVVVATVVNNLTLY